MKRINIDDKAKALIFDCDGTLVDSMPLHMKAWKEAFKQFDEKYNEEFLFSLKGMKETEIIDLYNQSFGTSIDREKIVTAKHNYFINHLNEVKPIRIVVDVAKSFYGKVPLAVVSGSVSKIVYAELKAAEIFELFQFILTANDPYKPKPDPEIFFAAASKINVNPEFCLVFEDGDAGLEAALKAGMKTIDVRNYF